MSEDQGKAAKLEIQGDAFQGEPPPRTPEEERDTDRSTVWYCIGTGDLRMLRMVLLDQNAKTRGEWRKDAETLIHELDGADRYHTLPTGGISEDATRKG